MTQRISANIVFILRTSSCLKYKERREAHLQMKNIASLWETERYDSRSQIFWFRYHEKMQNPKLDFLQRHSNNIGGKLTKTNTALNMVQFNLLLCAPPPPAYPRELGISFFLAVVYSPHPGTYCRIRQFPTTDLLIALKNMFWGYIFSRAILISLQ